MLVRRSTAGSDHYQVVTSSLEGAFESAVSVDYQACLAEAFDPRLDQRYIACTERHASQELTVAPVLAPLDEPFSADVAERAATACNASAEAADQINRHQSVVAFYPQDEAVWATGERTADCWVIANEGTLPPLTERH